MIDIEKLKDENAREICRVLESVSYDLTWLRVSDDVRGTDAEIKVVHIQSKAEDLKMKIIYADILNAPLSAMDDELCALIGAYARNAEEAEKIFKGKMKKFEYRAQKEAIEAEKHFSENERRIREIFCTCR